MALDTQLVQLLAAARGRQAAEEQAQSPQVRTGQALGQVGDLLALFGRNAQAVQERQQQQQQLNVAAQGERLKQLLEVAKAVKEAGVQATPGSLQEQIRAATQAPAPQAIPSFLQKLFGAAPPLVTPPAVDISKLQLEAKPQKDNEIFVDKTIREVFLNAGFSQSAIPDEGQVVNKTAVESAVKLGQSRIRARALLSASTARSQNQKTEWLKVVAPLVKEITDKMAKSKGNESLGLAPTFIPTKEDLELVNLAKQFSIETGLTIFGTPRPGEKTFPGKTPPSSRTPPSSKTPAEIFPGLNVKPESSAK